jgi:microcystin-dependent protein
MAQPYVGEIRIFAGNFPPNGWLFCDGQLLPISENETLFQLIGTTYGGDGQQTFGLPDLQGRVPLHQSANHPLGGNGGFETITLSVQQIPVHTHALLGSENNGAQADPSNNVLATSTVLKPYANETPDKNMAATAISSVGGNQPHENMQPYLVVNFIISLFGIFPSPS